MKMDGHKVRESIIEEIREETDRPSLAVILVGESEASRSFIQKKKEMCRKLGFGFELEKFEKNPDLEDLIQTVRRLNQDDEINGILPQLPMPGVDENLVFEEIDPEKDVDGLNPENLGLLLKDSYSIAPGTVEAILEILEYYEVEITGKDVTVVNNSNLIGKPLSMALTNSMATVTLCHVKTEDLRKHTQNADILVTATGQPDLITADMVKQEAVVIDAGYAKEDGKVKGDVKFDEVKEKASKITPNPGGVGPVTVAVTMRNLLKCYRMQKDES